MLAIAITSMETARTDVQRDTKESFAMNVSWMIKKLNKQQNFVLF